MPSEPTVFNTDVFHRPWSASFKYNKHSEDHHRHNTVRSGYTTMVNNDDSSVMTSSWISWLIHISIGDLHGFATCWWLDELRWLTFAVSFTGKNLRIYSFLLRSTILKGWFPSGDVFASTSVGWFPSPTSFGNLSSCRHTCKFSKSLPFLGISCPSVFRIRRKKRWDVGQVLTVAAMKPSTPTAAQ